jgi:hypothetical protein
MIAGKTGSPGRSGNRGSGTEVPPTTAAESRPAAMHAAKMRPAATHAANVSAAEMATTSEMATAAEMTAPAVTTTTVAPTATMASAASGIGRARQRDRKNNHGQNFEF